MKRESLVLITSLVIALSGCSVTTSSPSNKEMNEVANQEPVWLFPAPQMEEATDEELQLVAKQFIKDSHREWKHDYTFEQESIQRSQNDFYYSCTLDKGEEIANYVVSVSKSQEEGEGVTKHYKLDNMEESKR